MSVTPYWVLLILSPGPTPSSETKHAARNIACACIMVGLAFRTCFVSSRKITASEEREEKKIALVLSTGDMVVGCRIRGGRNEASLGGDEHTRAAY